VTISAIHRVSLATHDLAEAQKFFESYIGLGRAVKAADQTISFGSGSRGLANQKAAEAAQPNYVGIARIGRHSPCRFRH
jgi:catechol-2,3-dioxygenase